MPHKRKSPAGNGASKYCFGKYKNTKFSYKNQGLPFDKVNSVALLSFYSLLLRWLPGGTLSSGEYTALNPTRADRSKGSFKINIRTGRWCDFASGDKGGDPISLAAYLYGLSQKDALHRVARELGIK